MILTALIVALIIVFVGLITTICLAAHRIKKDKRALGLDPNTVRADIEAEYAKRFQEWTDEFTRKHAKDVEVSLDGQRRFAHAKVNESFAPMMPDWPYPFHDSVPFINTIDYIVFENRESDNPEDCRVIFVEVKCNHAKLTKSQRNVRYAIEHGKVGFEVFRIKSDII